MHSDDDPATEPGGIFFLFKNKIAVAAETLKSWFADQSNDSSSDNGHPERERFMRMADDEYSQPSQATPSTIVTVHMTPPSNIPQSNRSGSFDLVLTRVVSQPEIMQQYIEDHPEQGDRLKGFAQAILQQQAVGAIEDLELNLIPAPPKLERGKSNSF